MSRSKLIRALLAAASLLGAVPLMAQTRATATTAVVAAPAFPYGNYTLQATDSAHAPPPGFWVEFTSNTIKVMNGDQLVETHGSLFNGDKWQIFEFDGGCQEPGDYRWHLAGTTIWMEVINDPCTDRAQSIASIRFLKR